MKRLAVDLGGKAVVMCDVAATPAEQARGLQARATLPHGDGMLFPFEPARATQFHMAGVAYPIDLVFVGAGGAVERIVHNAQPGSKERWAHGHCSAVVETPGGFALRAELRLGDTVNWPARIAEQPYDLLRGLTDEGDERGSDDIEPYNDRGLPDEVDPNAMDDANPHWEQSIGYSQADPTYREEDGPGLRWAGSNTADIVSDAVLAVVDHFAAVPWQSNGKAEHAVVTARDLQQWLEPSALNYLATPNGLKVLGDGLVLSGLADIVQTNDNNLTLWRGVKR